MRLPLLKAPPLWPVFPRCMRGGPWQPSMTRRCSLVHPDGPAADPRLARRRLASKRALLRATGEAHAPQVRIQGHLLDLRPLCWVPECLQRRRVGGCHRQGRQCFGRSRKLSQVRKGDGALGLPMRIRVMLSSGLILRLARAPICPGPVVSWLRNARMPCRSVCVGPSGCNAATSAPLLLSTSICVVAAWLGRMSCSRPARPRPAIPSAPTSCPGVLRRCVCDDIA